MHVADSGSSPKPITPNPLAVIPEIRERKSLKAKCGPQQKVWYSGRITQSDRGTMWHMMLKNDVDKLA